MVPGHVDPAGRAGETWGMNPSPPPSRATPAEPPPAFLPRAAGCGLITFAALSVLLMSLHPTTGTHEVGEFVARAGRGVPGNTFVHGSLITLILLSTACFASLRDALGAHRPVVRAGMFALIVGTSGLVAAGLVNGFIVPNTAAHFLDASASDLAPLKPVLVLARETGATCARVGIVGLSLSSVAWSARLIRMPGWRRAAGAIGLACGLAPLALHLGEHLNMDVPGFGLFVRINAVWAGVAGVVLLNHRAELSARPMPVDPQS